MYSRHLDYVAYACENKLGILITDALFQNNLGINENNAEIINSIYTI